MTLHPKRRAPLAAEGIQELLGHRERIQEEALGKIPDGLAQATTQSVMRLVRNETPARVLAPRVLELVRQTLRGLARQHGTPDTALILRKRLEDGHGASQ